MKAKEYLSCTNIAWNCSVFIILIAVVLLPLILAAEEPKELVVDDPPTEKAYPVVPGYRVLSTLAGSAPS